MTTFTSELSAVVRAHRAARLARERAAMQLELTAYRVVAARLQPAIQTLLTQIEAESPTTAQLQRLARYRELLEQVESQISMFAGLVNARVTAEQAAFVDMALAQTAELAEALGIGGTFNRVPTRALSNLVGALADGSPLARLLGRYGPDAAQRVGQVLIKSVGLGLSPRLIAGDVQRALGVARWQALRLTRTETLRAYRGAALEQYRVNDDVITGWQWLAANDARTCGFCRGQHGKVFGLDVEFHSIPGVHPQCRCTPLPRTKSYEEVINA
jgi:SPP1 gp7 family putative phage head morphogenesis protein